MLTELPCRLCALQVSLAREAGPIHVWVARQLIGKGEALTLVAGVVPPGKMHSKHPRGWKGALERREELLPPWKWCKGTNEQSRCVVASYSA
jgi:hypothetical protein